MSRGTAVIQRLRHSITTIVGYYIDKHPMALRGASSGLVYRGAKLRAILARGALEEAVRPCKRCSKLADKLIHFFLHSFDTARGYKVRDCGNRRVDRLGERGGRGGAQRASARRRPQDAVAASQAHPLSPVHPATRPRLLLLLVRGAGHSGSRGASPQRRPSAWGTSTSPALCPCATWALLRPARPQPQPPQPPQPGSAPRAGVT